MFFVHSYVVATVVAVQERTRQNVCTGWDGIVVGRLGVSDGMCGNGRQKKAFFGGRSKLRHPLKGMCISCTYVIGDFEFVRGFVLP